MTDSGAIVEAQADLAVKLLRQVSNEGKSTTIFSPTSVAIALSMVYAGAKGKTAKQMGQLLANGAADSKVHEYFGELLQSLNNGQKKYTLEMANKVYMQNGFTVLDAYKAMIDRHYNGLFESVNFLQRETTAKTINDFVEKATHDKIHDFIQPKMLDLSTRLILINAVYLLSIWQFFIFLRGKQIRF